MPSPTPCPHLPRVDRLVRFYGWRCVLEGCDAHWDRTEDVPADAMARYREHRASLPAWLVTAALGRTSPVYRPAPLGPECRDGDHADEALDDLLLARERAEGR